MKDNRRIKNFLVRPSRQLRFVLLTSISVTILFSIAVFVIVRSLIVNLAFAANDFQINPVFQQKMNVGIQQSTVQILIVGTIFLFLSIISMIVFTHRFYGPIVPIKKFIKQIREGNYSARLSIRDTDELHDIVIELNEMARDLEDRSLRN